MTPRQDLNDLVESGPMSTWAEFTAAEPDFAERVAERFRSYRHHTVATVRRDGAPRISGTEVEFDDGELCFGVMAGARRIGDLQADPRLALHSHSVDPSTDDPSAWSGEAKIAGNAIEIGDAQGGDGSRRYRIDLTEVVLTRVGTPADHLLIESWGPHRGLTRHQRY